MNASEFEAWIGENGTGDQQRHTVNTIDYIFAAMKDGWLAIFENRNGAYIPKIQAKTESKALDYCVLREPAPIGLNHLCPV
jgi:hypothetical protein